MRDKRVIIKILATVISLCSVVNAQEKSVWGSAGPKLNYGSQSTCCSSQSISRIDCLLTHHLCELAVTIYGDTRELCQPQLIPELPGSTRIMPAGLRALWTPNLVNTALRNSYDGRLSGLCITKKECCFGEQMQSASCICCVGVCSLQQQQWCNLLNTRAVQLFQQ